MLKTFLILGCLLCAASPCRALSPADDAQRLEAAKTGYAMEWAAQDIGADIRFWLGLGQEKNNVHIQEYWLSLLSSKLPSQPVAVFEVMQKSEIPVDWFCYPTPLDSEDTLRWQWEAALIHSLRAITFTDAGQEAMRQECLRVIEKNYGEYLGAGKISQ